MAMPMDKRERLVLGRNYVETLLLTFEQHSLSTGHSPEDDEYIVRRLEELVCSMALSIPQIKNIYHNKIRALMKNEHPELPEIQLGPGCYSHHTVYTWLDRNRDILIEHIDPNMGLRGRTAVERFLRAETIRIIRTAVLATLIEIGSIKVT